MRHLLSCWWSKPLPEKHSYERILCFEGCFKLAVRSPAVVGAAFKALISMCKDKDIKVMMPLLTSKDKVISHDVILSYSLCLEVYRKIVISWLLIFDICKSLHFYLNRCHGFPYVQILITYIHTYISILCILTCFVKIDQFVSMIVFK